MGFFDIPAGALRAGIAVVAPARFHAAADVETDPVRGRPHTCGNGAMEMSHPPRRFGVSLRLVAISSWSDAAGEPCPWFRHRPSWVGVCADGVL